MNKEDQKLESYQYELPEDRIAQSSAEPRDSARLFVIDRHSGKREHKQIKDIVNILNPGDLLVLNNTKVFKARLHAISSTGRIHEVLLIPRVEDGWQAICSQTRKLKVGIALYFPKKIPDESIKELSEKRALQQMAKQRKIAETANVSANITAINRETGEVDISFNVSEEEVFAFTDQYGEVPLPPYIENTETDLGTYQTTFAKEVGSVAAPTAGRHFTPELLERLKKKGVQIEYITLHVGIGTFLPVWVEDIREHQMHAEWLSISKKTIQKMNKVKERGSRVIAVGTTVTRALEGAYKESNGNLEEGFEGYTGIFIAPGFEFKMIDGLLTNFHLPGTSLLMLVSAFMGRTEMLRVYEEAIKEKYRFYSLGDAMLIL